MHGLEAKTAAFMRGLFPADRRATVLVGVSGGADSVALLRALHAVQDEIHVALRVVHVNHMLRGDAAREDAAFVEALCRRLDAPCEIVEQSVADAAKAKGMGLEEAGRHVRYACFRTLAERWGACAVALGHTADDNVETALHRILRGAGVRGLAGIPSVRPLAPDSPVLLVRPFLDVWREEIEAYLRGLGQDWREDASNASLAFQRNWVRHRLLPLVSERYGAAGARAVERLSRQAAELVADLDAQAADAWERVLSYEDAGLVELRRSAFLALPRMLREPVLRLAWRRLGLSEKGMGFEHWSELLELLRSGSGRVSLPGGAGAECAGDAAALYRADCESSGAWPLPCPGEVRLPALQMTLAAAPAPLGEGFSKSNDEELVDADKLRGSLTVRFRADGDAFHPLGAPGRRKLKQFFIDAKVPRWRRGRTPLVADEEGIVWVAGLRIAERVRVGPGARRGVKLSLQRAPK